MVRTSGRAGKFDTRGDRAWHAPIHIIGPVDIDTNSLVTGKLRVTGKMPEKTDRLAVTGP